MKIEQAESLIAVEGIQVHAYHGVYQNERKEGNLYIVDVYMETNMERAAASDQLEDTLDYFQVYNRVLEIMSEPVHLLEHLTKKIGINLMESFQSLESIRLRVSKVQPHAMESCVQTYVEMKIKR
ncbi:MAG: dihydroneopterin aldolase [Bacteroidia bacterium]|nr:dihydroneopterin aldolase [Bacteroidia bacterium]